MYVLNAWYVAAWSTEVTREPIRRTICELPIVLYRKENGETAALIDRCAHRGYPLSAGRLVGDAIECGYHGFTFGCDGVCTRVPAQSSIPARAVVRAFPLLEKDGWIWVWTGDPAKADPASVPDTHWMNDPEWATVTHSVPFACRADLIHDNLLDLTHEPLILKTTLGDAYIYAYGVTVYVDHVIDGNDAKQPVVLIDDGRRCQVVAAELISDVAAFRRGMNDVSLLLHDLLDPHGALGAQQPRQINGAQHLVGGVDDENIGE